MNTAPLKDAIELDQLHAVRKTVGISIPINMILGTAALLVSLSSGYGRGGLLWFSVSLSVNLLRLILCRIPIDNAAMAPSARRWTVAAHLRFHWFLALLSGLVWAAIPTLCEGYTSAQTLFYLTVVCGISAGAVTHGFAFAIIPIAFITPPLLSVFGCLIWVGGFDRYCLAATVLLYWGALIRSTRVGQALVRNESRLKHEATALSESLAIANQQANFVARQMQERAVRDDLTGLLNRRGFTEAADSFLTGITSCGLVLIDLDGFKSVNDAFGHAMGDRVLAEVARRLAEAVPNEAVLARLGGDEFVLLYDPSKHQDQPAVLATRLIASLSIPYSHLDAGRIGAGVGIYHGSKSLLDEMLIYADSALYAAKKEGRNRFRLFDDGLRAQALMHRDVERDLPTALGAGALQVWYQPIVGRNGRDLDSFEALLRWNHSAHGWVPPLELVSIAAKAGLSEPLLRFILGETCKMIRALKDVRLERMRVAINVSPREISQLDLDELIFRQFDKEALPLTMLEVEITEEMLINPIAVHDKLSRLAQKGVCLALDDFGSGYSSLGSLQKIHVDRVKIDASFVKGIKHSSVGRSLVAAVLQVSGAFGFEVVAEGVETREDMLALRELGCSLMQGYYIARAMPLAEALHWAQHQNQGSS